MKVHVLFDGPPGPEPGRFVEVETPEGRSLRVGQWIDKGGGLWALALDVIVDHPAAEPRDPAEWNGRPPFMDEHLTYECTANSKGELKRMVDKLMAADTCFAVIGGELRLRFHDRGASALELEIPDA